MITVLAGNGIHIDYRRVHKNYCVWRSVARATEYIIVSKRGARTRMLSDTAGKQTEDDTDTRENCCFGQRLVSGNLASGICGSVSNQSSARNGGSYTLRTFSSNRGRPGASQL